MSFLNIFKETVKINQDFKTRSQFIGILKKHKKLSKSEKKPFSLILKVFLMVSHSITLHDSKLPFSIGLTFRWFHYLFNALLIFSIEFFEIFL